MNELTGYINFENEKINFFYKEFRIKFVIDDETLRNKFYQTYNRKKNFVLSGIAIASIVAKRGVQFYIREMRMNDFEVLCVIVGHDQQIDEYNSIRIESGMLDEIFKFRHYFIDEVVRKDSKVNLYKNKKIIDENTFLINDKSYFMQYFVGNLVDRGIGSSFRINGKLSVSLVDKTIQEIYNICRIISKFIYFTSYFPSDYIAKASRISLHMGESSSAWVEVADIEIDDYKFSSGACLKYEHLKRRINQIVELLYNGVCDNKKATLFIDHLNFEFIKNTSTERFMSQCRGFEYLFKRCEKNDAHKVFYDKAKSIFNMNKNSEFAAKLLYIRNTYTNLTNLTPYPINDADLVEIFTLRNSITHGDCCFSELQPQQARLTYILDDFLLAMNLKLVGFDETEIENIIKGMR